MHSSQWETHLSYGMSPDTWDLTVYPTRVNSPRLNPSKLVLDSLILEGWKAELT